MKKRYEEHGYTIFLHRKGEKPEDGFGYGDGSPDNGCAPCVNIGLQAVKNRCVEWATLFGREYEVTVYTP